MSCPSEQAWLVAELGDVTINERAALLKHAEHCATCTAARERQQRLLSDLAAPLRLQTSGEDFLAGVLARSKQPQAAPATAGSSGMLWPWMTALSVAAALALVALPSGDDPEIDRVQARGGKPTRASEHAVASADVLLAGEKTLTNLTDATLHAGDRLAVRIQNPSSEAAFLLAFAIDSRGDVHWLFPAYTDDAQNPSSLPLTETHAPLLLPETVELVDPAPGTLRVVSIVSRQRTTVLEVEKLLAARRGQPLTRVFPDARLREWKCTWSAR